MKYAILDRDGTLLFEPQTDYTVVSSELLPGVETALKDLQANGYTLFLLSNQDGLGTEMNPTDNFEQVNEEMLHKLSDVGIEFEGFVWCPHTLEDACDCRKPQTKLLDSLDISSDSITIGDRRSDLQLAENLGIRGVKVETNKGWNYEDTQK